MLLLLISYVYGIGPSGPNYPENNDEPQQEEIFYDDQTRNIHERRQRDYVVVGNVKNPF
jgi:hypothetical protein